MNGKFPTSAVLTIAASLAGSAGGSWISVQVTVARVEERVVALERDMRDLQAWRTEHEKVTRQGLSDIARLEGRKK